MKNGDSLLKYCETRVRVNSKRGSACLNKLYYLKVGLHYENLKSSTRKVGYGKNSPYIHLKDQSCWMLWPLTMILIAHHFHIYYFFFHSNFQWLIMFNEVVSLFKQTYIFFMRQLCYTTITCSDFTVQITMKLRYIAMICFLFGFTY